MRNIGLVFTAIYFVYGFTFGTIFHLFGIELSNWHKWFEFIIILITSGIVLFKFPKLRANIIGGGFGAYSAFTGMLLMCFALGAGLLDLSGNALMLFSLCVAGAWTHMLSADNKLRKLYIGTYSALVLLNLVYGAGDENYSGGELLHYALFMASCLYWAVALPSWFWFGGKLRK